jgi:hypothetical protein
MYCPMLTWNRKSAALRCRVMGPLLLTLFIPACGDNGDQARARHEAAQHPKADGVVAVPAGPDIADMVSAVSTADATPPVSLKFRLAEAPRIGQPSQLMLALIQEPKLAIEAMHVAMQPRDGLQLLSPATTDFAAPAEGATQMIPVTIQAQQPGVLSLAVTVLVNTERESLARSYTIPMVVVQPAAAAAAPAVAAAPKAPAARSATRH